MRRRAHRERMRHGSTSAGLPHFAFGCSRKFVLAARPNRTLTEPIGGAGAAGRSDWQDRRSRAPLSRVITHVVKEHQQN
jgi:hypothetical protein